MKNFAILLLLVFFLVGCKKKEEQPVCCDMPQALYLFGKWVDVNNPLDTLVAYGEGNKTLLFDNSAYYRANRATITDSNAFKMQFRLNDNKIGVKFYNSTSADPYFYYDFTWVEYGKKFTMLQNAIRPYLSSMPVGTYQRVF